MSSEQQPATEDQPIQKTDATETTTDVSSEIQPDQRPKFRWGMGLAILVIGLTGYYLSQNVLTDDAYWQAIYTMVFGSGIPFFLILWWTFLSGLSWNMRLGGLAALAVLVVGAFSSGAVQITEFEGSGLPKFEFGWNDSPESRAIEFWEQQGDSVAGSIPETVDLTITAADWPGFRGAKRDGIYSFERIRTDWKQNPPRLVWRHPVGLGWSSFAIVGGYAITQEQREQNEAVVCYDAKTGETIWVHENESARFTESMGGDGPRATPVIDDGKVYALGATGILDCLSARTGELIWTHNILDDAGAPNLFWGMSATPLIFQNMVIVNPGDIDTLKETSKEKQNKAVIAYDKQTGKIIWANSNRIASYCAPRVETIGGMDQILIFSAEGLAGHDPASGEELWFRALQNQPKVNAAQPIVIDNKTIFFGCAYSLGSLLIDVEKDGDTWKVTDRWPEINNKMRLKFNDGYYKNGHIYGLDDGILACINLETGKRTWKRGRYQYGQMLQVNDDKLLILAESGDVVLVEMNPKSFNELNRFHAIDGKCWCHPVVYNGHLYVRNAGEAACYEISER